MKIFWKIFRISSNKVECSSWISNSSSFRTTYLYVLQYHMFNLVYLFDLKYISFNLTFVNSWSISHWYTSCIIRISILDLHSRWQSKSNNFCLQNPLQINFTFEQLLDIVHCTSSMLASGYNFVLNIFEAVHRRFIYVRSEMQTWEIPRIFIFVYGFFYGSMWNR